MPGRWAVEGLTVTQVSVICLTGKKGRTAPPCFVSFEMGSSLKEISSQSFAERAKVRRLTSTAAWVGLADERG